MIGHRSRFQENDDLPLWRGLAVKKKPPFSNARALITRDIERYCFFDILQSLVVTNMTSSLI